MAEQTKVADVVASLRDAPKDRMKVYLAAMEAASKRLRLGVEGPRIADELDKAATVFAELVSADVEYDVAADAVAEAKREKGNWRVNPLGHAHPAVVRMRAAKARRAAALAAVRGAASHG